ncbi:translation initiation factor IF-2, partial [Mesorhizobium sp. M00.F.Ca.ET.217.01.1.1]
KPTANPDRVMQELTEYGLIPEAWGGDTIFVPLSALSGDGIEDLIEMIVLTSEIQELKANPEKKAVGTVIEAELDKSRGPSASLLVQNGTLHVGDA